MAVSLASIREKYPSWRNLSDPALADALYDKFYRDMPREQFDRKLADNGDVVDQVLAGFTSGVDAVPIVGPATLDGLEQLKSWIHGVPVETVQLDTERMQSENPTASTVGGVVGTALPFLAGAEIPVAARLLGIDAAVGVVPRTIANTVATTALTTVDKLARGYGW